MSVAWDFGDGTTASESLDTPVTHTYQDAGEHTVTADVEGHDEVLDTTVTAVRPPARNYIGSDNRASLEDGTTEGWLGADNPSIYNWTHSSSTEQSLHGERSLRCQYQQSGMSFRMMSDAERVALGDVGGQTLTFMIGVYLDAWPSTSGGQTVQLQRRFYNAGGSNITSITGSIELPGPVGQWQKVRQEWPAPANTVAINLSVWSVNSGNVATKRWYLDRAGLFVGSVAWEDWTLPSAVPAP